jgi:hypothetical protein
MKSLRSVAIILFATILWQHGAAAVAFPSVPIFASEQISVSQWKAYLMAVSTVPSIRCDTDQRNQFVCVYPRKKTIWLFTQTGHPAHPAVTRATMTRALTAVGNDFTIQRDGNYTGNAEEYKKWLRAIRLDDSRQINQWRRLFFATPQR